MLRNAWGTPSNISHICNMRISKFALGSALHLLVSLEPPLIHSIYSTVDNRKYIPAACDLHVSEQAKLTHRLLPFFPLMSTRDKCTRVRNWRLKGRRMVEALIQKGGKASPTIFYFLVTLLIDDKMSRVAGQMDGPLARSLIKFDWHGFQLRGAPIKNLARIKCIIKRCEQKVCLQTGLAFLEWGAPRDEYFRDELWPPSRRSRRFCMSYSRAYSLS